MPGQAPILRISPAPRYMAGVAGGRGVDSSSLRGRLPSPRTSKPKCRKDWGAEWEWTRWKQEGRQTVDRARNCRPWQATDPLTCPFETAWHGALAACGALQAAACALFGAPPQRSLAGCQLGMGLEFPASKQLPTFFSSPAHDKQHHLALSKEIPRPGAGCPRPGLSL